MRMTSPAVFTSTRNKLAGNSFSIARAPGATNTPRNHPGASAKPARWGCKNSACRRATGRAIHIEVQGRKISGTARFDGNLIFYQGTLLIDFDPAIRCLPANIPGGKARQARDPVPRQRNASSPCGKCSFCSLRRRSGRQFTPGWSQALPKVSIAPQREAITPDEEELAERAFREEIGTDAYVTMLDAPPADDALVSASLTGRGGTVRADIRLEGPRRDRIRERSALITPAILVTPPRVVFDLEASLRGLDVAEGYWRVESRVAGFEASPRPRLGQVIEMARYDGARRWSPADAGFGEHSI